jgi:acetate kinase
VEVDNAANDQASECISIEGSDVDIRVIAADEENMIARHARSRYVRTVEMLLPLARIPN